MTQLKVSIKKISPLDAKRILENNKLNRKLNQRWVAFYYRQMVNGDWLSTGDSIKFSSKGELRDGQHRLHALVKYGKPLDFVVVENVSDEAFNVIDTGKSRSAGDALAIHGLTNPLRLAAAARYILLFKAGYYSSDSGAGKKADASNLRVIEFVKANQQELSEIVSYCHGVYQKFRFMPESLLSASYWLFSQKSQSMCNDFFEKYTTGINLTEKNPVRLLRDRLVRDSANKTKLTGREKMMLFIMAWNHCRTNSKPSSLVLTKNQKFPSIK